MSTYMSFERVKNKQERKTHSIYLVGDLLWTYIHNKLHLDYLCTLILITICFEYCECVQVYSNILQWKNKFEKNKRQNKVFIILMQIPVVAVEVTL